MYKAIVIDDEESARESVSLLLKKNYSEIELVGKADSLDAGLGVIKDQAPQIIFLDINMPGKSGLELFNHIEPGKYQVIFTTAYDEYALKAINLSACYYLLKPISPSEFTKAVTLAIARIRKETNLSKNLMYLKELVSKPVQYPEKLIVNNKNGYELISIADIMYFEGDKNYTWIHIGSEKYLAAKTLKEYEEIINPDFFYRTHQSYIVNKHFVKSILNTKPDQVELKNGTLLGIARDRKKQFLDWVAK